MKSFFAKLFVALWLVLLSALGVYYVMFAPTENSYSEEENRNLAGFPEFTLSSLISGDFMESIESYLLDRFPNRPDVISATNRLENTLSLASYEEYVLIADGPQDALDSDDYLNDLDSLLSGLNQSAASTSPTPTAIPTKVPTETPVITEVPLEPDAAPTETPLPTATPTPTPSPTPAETPPIEQKPVASEADYPEKVGVYMERNGSTKTISTASRTNVMAVTAVLNKYASLLPENGKLMFTVVPQSIYANQFVNAADKQSFYANWDDVVNGFGSNNVYAFDTAEILTDAIKEGTYVYFRTDMHWNPYGSYLVYREMAKRAGVEPCDYDNDFEHTMEEPFRGTYYRDNPSAYEDVAPDSLDLLMPKYPLEWRRITGKDTYKLIDFLDFNARKNDRYTVYLGGPAGPWTYAEMDNHATENCLVLTDSFGLGYLPFLTTNYKQVHYYDPRYFNQGTVGYTVAEMIENYNIQDIYVVVGDLHSFDSSFLLNYANSQLYGE